MEELHDARGESAAGALAADDDARRVDTELGGVALHPVPRGADVVERGGERMLGREPVVRRHDRHAESGGRAAREALVLAGVADHEAAAVHPEEGGIRALHGWAVDAHAGAAVVRGAHAYAAGARDGHDLQRDCRGASHPRLRRVGAGKGSGCGAKVDVDHLEVHAPTLVRVPTRVNDVDRSVHRCRPARCGRGDDAPRSCVRPCRRGEMEERNARGGGTEPSSKGAW